MENKNCKNCKKDFTIKPDDFSFYEKMKVPPPTFCPDCRSQRRNAWRNNFSMYSRKCELCDKSVVSIYSPSSKIKIYCNKCWWSDNWDPKSYGVTYDFSKPFFEQFRDLIDSVPHMTSVNDDGIASLNCEYTNDIWFSKNCYMVFSGWRIENIMYSSFLIAGKDIVDSHLVMAESSYMYECINCSHGYRLRNSFFSRACVDSHFLYDCQNCSDCFMCTGLRNKKFHFKNKEYSKEEYQKILNEYRLDTYKGVEKAQKEYDEFILSYPRRYAWMKQDVDSSGDVVSYSKNTHHCFIAKKCENCKYGEYVTFDKDSYDISMTGEMSECYESVVADHSQLNMFGLFSVKSQDIKYTQHCHSSKHLFGCVGLRNSSYCIFNKQYTKEEYEELVPKIIEHMNTMPYIDKKGRVYKYGEYYPIEQSPFGYNETFAMEQFPLSRDEASSEGYNWQDKIQRTIGKETISNEEIPESIKEVSDEIVNNVLKCVDCNRNYKILPNELVFYKKMDIPIPLRCFSCRYSKRMNRMNPFKLWHRTCMCKQSGHNHEGNCHNEFETSYAPDRPEIVYCEGCYQNEVN